MKTLLKKVAIITLATSTIYIVVATTASATSIEHVDQFISQEFIGEIPPVDESTELPIIMTAAPIEREEILNEYIVQAGDTLTKISEEFNLDVPTLMQWNNLLSDFLSIGQVISVNGQVEPTEEQIVAAKEAETKRQRAEKERKRVAVQANQSQRNVQQDKTQTPSTSEQVAHSSDLIAVAKQYLGAPYVYGGKTPGGFDCSGFVSYVFEKVGKLNSYHSSIGLYNIAKKVSTPQVGDLVFFSGTYRSGISHVGIYIGNNQMISASGKKVQIANIYNSYWSKHFTGFGRI